MTLAVRARATCVRPRKFSSRPDQATSHERRIPYGRGVASWRAPVVIARSFAAARNVSLDRAMSTFVRTRDGCGGPPFSSCSSVSVGPSALSGLEGSMP
jgi:hypothetical protein